MAPRIADGEDTELQLKSNVSNNKLGDIESGEDAKKSVPENLPILHKVLIPARTPLVHGLKDAVKEIFFPDDPFQEFKNQPRKRKYLLGLLYVFPILDWGWNYSIGDLKGDVIAGLTIASLAVPQDIGYAKLANLSPVHGLYSSFVPPLIYAALGSSRHIAIGPVAVVSTLLGTQLRRELNPITQPELYLRLALTATFFAGLVEFTIGFLRLGFVIDFLSHATIVGFMAGAGITIALQQLKGFLGITHFTTDTDFISVMRSVWRNTDEWNWQTALIGSFFLVFLFITKYIGKRYKRLFWVSALGPLASVILATAFVKVTRIDRHGVKIVQHIHKGVNPSSIHELFFHGTYLGKGARIGVVAGLVALTEAIAIGRTFAALKDYHVDGNKEMIAIGLGNMAGSCTSCYVATGSFSRSAVNYNAGCNTPLTNIVMSIVVLITLIALTPLFYYTPNAVLSSIIISAVLGLVDFKAAFLIWKVDKIDFIACLGAFLGVFFVSVEIGLLIAVGISLTKILLHVTRPHTALLGKIPETNIYRNLLQYPDAGRIPGILIVRVDSSIYFCNSNYVRERTLRWVNEEGEKISASNGISIQYAILEMSLFSCHDHRHNCN
ncbi:hypothetical protein O6H91_02G090500 [Diphasiastrum complanatum]|uniref:Uncharacterized protein n=4 Tax=Diphasiastrum complanatum TaxID=34168 RepID=A0ACC2EIG4_DIPCM|nr:hypothetical protein O6H91_02G090500 [Diphasiastrum complanatum]KAJ7566155.1 hypothetical protein O6H91_02G090500 [Diphasiastrum complanatum]KAJ7566156.1 hypothetical protein O6H91_02G090500 [Diphasiastrum complanatum]KAJ7566157.1 hypothetical protein O6H91_02G090500 [Diphasiastrum complanatum]